MILFTQLMNTLLKGKIKMFDKIINNLINGNYKDFKGGIKKLSLNQRYEFVQHLQNNDYNINLDYVLMVIITKDFKNV